jgi:hypothetical protein
MPLESDKQQVAVRIPLRQRAELEREAAEQGVSRSECTRSILSDRDRADELEEHLEVRKARIDELERQLAERSQIKEKVDTLARQQDEEAPFFLRWYDWWRRRGD